MLVSLLLIFTVVQFSQGASDQKPNFIVIYADDTGYGDLQSYGHPTQEKGPIDVMAEEGMKFTNWYTASATCSPSRAALLTGRLPIRIGVFGDNYRVFRPNHVDGIPKSEITIAESLKSLGYATGMVGKWHLGANQYSSNDGSHLPFHHGFDFVGTNFPFGQEWACNPQKFSSEEMSGNCFKYLNETIIQQPTDMVGSTSTMVTDFKTFVEDNTDKPFFFYFAMLQTHAYTFCSSPFCGKSRRGKYGDNLNEMSWAVGEILDTLKLKKLEENTLVMFVSDNGPHVEMCTEGGSNCFLRGGKTTTWEGGIRVPAIAWWPGIVPARTISNEIISTMDIYSTFVELAGGKVEDDEIFRDSRSIVGVLKNQTSSPHDFLFHYCSDRLMAVRHGKYKVHFVTQDITNDFSDICPEGIPTKFIVIDCFEKATVQDPPVIYNLEEDPGEWYPLDPAEHTDLMEEVNEAVEKHKATIIPVKSLLEKTSDDVIPCCNPPQCQCNYNASAKSEHGEL